MKSLQKIPAPHFVVLYNGSEESADHETMHLSDAFANPQQQPKLQLEVDVYNINLGHNKGIMEACRTLEEYAVFVDRIRSNRKIMPAEEAVVNAVDSCIRDGILADFLRKNRDEVIGMSIYEFDRDKYEEIIFDNGFEEGKAEGKAEGNEQALHIAINNVMESLGLSLEQAMDVLKIQESDRPKYR